MVSAPRALFRIALMRQHLLEWRHPNLVSKRVLLGDRGAGHCHTHLQHVCAQNPGRCSNEVSYQHRKARQAQEEKPRWAVLYDSI